MARSRLLCAMALGAGLFTCERASGASSPAQAYSVFWQTDTSLRSGLDAFYACLTEGSSFSPTWANQFGISSVSYQGSYVLSSTLPAAVKLETDLQTVMTGAFDMGLVPPPASGSLTEYLLYIPSSTTVSDSTGSIFCLNTTDPCGVHHQASYKGVPYQYAAVPLNCTCHDPPAPSKLDDSARVGEHELAEGLADLGTAQYEVGDQCKTPRNTISCCGQTYQIQPLAGPNGIAVCQDITANGSPTACTTDGGASSSGGSSGSGSGSGSNGGSGTSSGSTGGSSGGTSSGSSGSTSGGASGSTSGSSTSSGGSGGTSGSSAGGGSGGRSGTGSGGTSGSSSTGSTSSSGMTMDAGIQSNTAATGGASGCGCKVVSSGTSSSRMSALMGLAALCAALVSLRRRRSRMLGERAK